jgi:phosphatidylglycerophosphate synthase
VAVGGNLALQAAFLAVAARRLGGPVITPANLVTLSRGLAAALLCGTAFSGHGLGAAWPALMAGCTVSDWLDGPLARRLGRPSRLGGVLDIEADSWLTLWASIAAHRRGGLSGFTVLGPTLRYLLTVGRPGKVRHWQRAAGLTQMVVLCGALAPWPAARGLARSVAPLAAAGQVLALVRGNHRPGVGEGVRIDGAHPADGLPLPDHGGGA